MEDKLQIGTIVKAPCKNYSGWAYAEIERVGEQSCTVRALFGNPWTEFSHGGYCPTNRRNIYIEMISLYEFLLVAISLGLGWLGRKAYDMKERGEL